MISAAIPLADFCREYYVASDSLALFRDNYHSHSFKSKRIKLLLLLFKCNKLWTHDHIADLLLFGRDKSLPTTMAFFLAIVMVWVFRISVCIASSIQHKRLGQNRPQQVQCCGYCSRNLPGVCIPCIGFNLDIFCT